MAGFLIEVMLRGLTVGALAALATGLWRTGAGPNVRWAALLACLGVAGYATAMCGPLRQAMGPAAWVATIFSFGVSAYVWLFVLVVFEDRRITPLTLAPIAVLTGLGLFNLAGGPGSAAWEPVSRLRDVAAIGLSAHALAVVLSSWRGDLVEARRRLRGPFFGVVACYVIAQTAVDAMIRNGAHLPWRDLTNAWALAILAVLAAAVFLDGRAALFGASRRAQRPTAAPDPALAQLARAMDEDEIWRREGLTIGVLAQAVGVPEHRLRRLINDHLGHRNFAAFINARRVAAAKAALSDPAQARVTIAALAYDLGFGSLGPFNRAFRASEGVAPRAWRRRALGAESLAETEIPA